MKDQIRKKKKKSRDSRSIHTKSSNEVRSKQWRTSNEVQRSATLARYKNKIKK